MQGDERPDNEVYVDLYPYAVRLTNDLLDPSNRDYPAVEIGLRPLVTEEYLRAHELKLVRQGWLEDPLNDGRVRLSLKGCQFMGLVLPGDNDPRDR